MRRALALVTEALDLLDGYDGPPDAAAHLNLAQKHLHDAIRSADNNAKGNRDS